MLPGRNILVVQEIRKFDEQRDIVMITGTGGVKPATLAVNQGADGYIDRQSLASGGDAAEFSLP